MNQIFSLWVFALTLSIAIQGIIARKYVITVYTGWRPHGGTDADVYISIFGENGSCKDKKLDISWHDDFERNSKDDYKIDCSDLGRIQYITVWHDDDNGLTTDEWQLTKIEVSQGDSKTIFECNCWLKRAPNEHTLFPVDHGTIKISENEPAGQLIIKLAKLAFTDKKPSQIIIQGKLQDHVQLEDNWDLVTSKSVDREFICPRKSKACRTKIELSETDEVYEIIWLEILDKNDNSPIFPESSGKIDIPEDTPVGTLWDLNVAEDADSLKYGVVKYSLVSGFGVFELMNNKKRTSDGNIVPQLKLVRPLDYEQTKIYELNVTAEDNGSGPCGNISVEDINQDPPFHGLYTESVEGMFFNFSHSNITLSKCIPAHTQWKDDGISLLLTKLWRLNEANELVSKTPRLTELRVWNGPGPGNSKGTTAHGRFEPKDEAMKGDWEVGDVLQVEGNSDSYIVNINVKDVNDNAPDVIAFSPDKTISEGLPVGSVVMNVYAIDIDSGINGQIEYGLSTDNSLSTYFHVDNTTGEITLARSLKHHGGENHQITIYAKDKALKPLKTEKTWDFTILECFPSDQGKNFNPQIEFISTVEDDCEVPVNSKGDMIGYFKITDEDKGQYGTPSLTMVNGTGLFGLKEENERYSVYPKIHFCYRDLQEKHVISFKAKDRNCGLDKYRYSRYPPCCEYLESVKAVEFRLCDVKGERSIGQKVTDKSLSPVDIGIIVSAILVAAFLIGAGFWYYNRREADVTS